MLKVRVMPTLLYKDLGLVKGVGFDSWRRTGSLMQAVASKQRVPAVQAELTSRESEVLDFLAEGLCNKTIARQLGISVGTVKVHVKHVLSKLNLHSRLEAVVWRHEQQKPTH